MKKCPFCAEVKKEEAVKCKHCGELVNEKPQKKNNSFAKYEGWLKSRYPMYTIVSRNEEDNILVVNKEHRSFKPLVCILLLILWIIPGIIYIIATANGKKFISVTIQFDDTGKAEVTDKKDFSFLATQYNASLNGSLVSK